MADVGQTGNNPIIQHIASLSSGQSQRVEKAASAGRLIDFGPIKVPNTFFGGKIDLRSAEDKRVQAEPDRIETLIAYLTKAAEAIDQAQSTMVSGGSGGAGPAIPQPPKGSDSFSSTYKLAT